MSNRESRSDPKGWAPSAPVILSPRETEQVSGGTIKKVNNGPGLPRPTPRATRIMDAFPTAELV